MQILMHIYVWLGGQEKHGMLTWFPSMLSLEATAILHFKVNNVPPFILGISSFSAQECYSKDKCVTFLLVLTTYCTTTGSLSPCRQSTILLLNFQKCTIMILIWSTISCTGKFINRFTLLLKTLSQVIGYIFTLDGGVKC